MTCRTCDEADKLRRDLATLQRQLDAVDVAVGFPDGSGRGRIEMITARAEAEVKRLRGQEDGR